MVALVFVRNFFIIGKLRVKTQYKKYSNMVSIYLFFRFLTVIHTLQALSICIGFEKTGLLSFGEASLPIHSCFLSLALLNILACPLQICHLSFRVYYPQRILAAAAVTTSFCHSFWQSQRFGMVKLDAR